MSVIAYHHAEYPEALTGGELDRRLAAGWFRMNQGIFTTTHLYTDDNFFRVHWLRYELSRIADRVSHRRIRRMNAGFDITIEKLSSIRLDHALLFARYRASITFDGAASISHAMLDDESPEKYIFETYCISIIDNNRLIAGGYFDVGEKSGASILHFFDPEYRRYSLGRYMMLVTIDYLRSNGFTHYYPGYVVSGKEKMNYKLFLGRDLAEYFDPSTGIWRPFDDRILVPERLSEVDKLQIALALSE